MWVNSKVFEMLGWDANTPDPPGGVIARDPSTRELTGLLMEMPAMEPAWELFPYPTKREYKTSLLWISDWLNRKGITTSHDAWMELDPNYYRAYDEMVKEGNLTVRYRGSWYIDEASDYLSEIEYALGLSEKFTHPHFQVNSFKFMADGAGETALLLEGNPEGIKVWEDEAMVNAFVEVDKAGYQIHVHTIGDGAVKYTVDALGKVQEMNGGRDSRHSLAHVEIASPEDVVKMGELGLYAHITQRLISQYSPHKSLFDEGVIVTVASDWTTSQFDVLTDIYRGMETNVSLEEMIKAATINGASANFLEDEIGSLEVGKKADIVV
ncbi:MAG: amidohydrolase family protein, partial [Planctomycetes bacterium]|nr:amidohydrolase family protein [Planctomycetota bacterium]